MGYPKICFFDIETQPTLGYVWELRETDVLRVVQNWKILCFSYKWYGGKTQTVSLPSVGTEKALVKALWKVFDEADIIIAHNGDKFDVRKSNAKFIEHNLKPPTPFKTIDTLKVARRHFKFDSNRLDALGEILGIGRKMKTGGFDLWEGCMKGDPSSWKLMEKYNKRDVDLLEKVYLRMRPWMDNHVNLNLLYGTRTACPNCGSHKLQSRGYAITRTNKFNRFQCQNCGAWSRAPLKGIVR